jgi:hypothetical protein
MYKIVAAICPQSASFFIYTRVVTTGAFMLGRDGFGLYPGFDPYIDELQMQDQYGPARRNAGAGLDAKF